MHNFLALFNYFGKHLCICGICATHCTYTQGCKTLHTNGWNLILWCLFLTILLVHRVGTVTVKKTKMSLPAFGMQMRFRCIIQGSNGRIGRAFTPAHPTHLTCIPWLAMKEKKKVQSPPSVVQQAKPVAKGVQNNTTMREIGANFAKLSLEKKNVPTWTVSWFYSAQEPSFFSKGNQHTTYT